MRRIYLIPGAIAALTVLTGVPAWMRRELPDTPRSANADVLLPGEAVVVQGVVPPSTTLDALLRGQGLADDAVAPVVEAVSRVFDPRRLRSRQPFELERGFDGRFRRFDYEIDNDAVLRVGAPTGPSGALNAEVLPIPVTMQSASAAAEVTRDASSLFAAMKAAGEGDELAVAMASIFSGEIDFNSEVQLGDRLAVAFERRQREGRPSTYGEIRAAEFSMIEGRTVRAVRFTTPDGRPAYYDEQGRSLKRMFLKSPLKFEPRVTSGFSMRRMHPVLHTSRAHRGVDYGAPTGAPVVAVASGAVMSATYDDSNGRMVRLRHTSGYQTDYLHLSRFAPGIRAGGHVDQGEVIGYVGSSGLATGPHLHFGLTKNGAFVNPIAEHRNMPPGEPVPESSMAAFRVVRDKALAELAAAGGASGARLASTRP